MISYDILSSQKRKVIQTIVVKGIVYLELSRQINHQKYKITIRMNYIGLAQSLVFFSLLGGENRERS